MSEVAMRTMTSRDIEPAFALEQVLYPADAWTMGQFIDELSRVPDSRYYVVLEENSSTLVGYAGLMCPHRGADSDIQTLSVAPSHQRRGLGERLLLELLDEARRRRSPAVFLEVRVDNDEALSLYRKHGFEVLGERRDYYAPGIHATTMRKVLT